MVGDCGWLTTSPAMRFTTKMRFVDTNVLLYAVSSLSQETAKRRLAIELLSNEDLSISVQVLQEFYYQATRPGRPAAISPVQALRFIDSIEDIPVQPITLAIFNQAVAVSRRYGLSYWDGAILAAARAIGCDAVYSEDMSDRQDYGGLRVINPFSGVSVE